VSYRKHAPYQSEKRDRDTRGESAARECLRCGRTFPSHHRGHRVCDTCKRDESWVYGDPFGQKVHDQPVGV
jgi:hypothetical protein